MTLDRDDLRDKFRAVTDPGFLFHAFPSSRDAAREAWTEIYDSYALDAEDVSGDSVLTVNRAGFKAALTLDFELTTPADLAAEFEAAFLAYWTSAVFEVGMFPATPTVPCPSVGGNLIWGTEVTSVVTAVDAVSVLPALSPIRAALTLEFANLTLDGEAKAEALADIFHAATTEDVTVLITGTDTGGPVPITNTCTVF